MVPLVYLGPKATQPHPLEYVSYHILSIPAMRRRPIACIYLWIEVVFDKLGPAHFSPFYLPPSGVQKHHGVTFGEVVQVF